ncbi:efflux RND transporter periplasmic adaptor subunit [Pusillimonas noertemannii]|uniref:efflux RND transporter periplasmic adaptor subunit n=1 Tax=Pusillimonas noertemannii TaxID=305977 RepID=UPI0002E374CF|nr:efflux RND transporter periplasmic adaptor subunit [Pusillimonas noertemannii]
MKNTSHKTGPNRRGRQALWVAVIILAGALLGAWILASDAPGKAGQGHDEHQHASQPGQAEESGHAHEDGEAHEGEERHGREAAFTDVQIDAAGITLATAGPARIRDAIQLPGEIVFDANRTAQLSPRLPGVVQAVQAELGQEVEQGQVLAVIASPELSERRSALRAAQRRLALASTTYERERLLWKEKISAEQDYLQARQQLQEARIAVSDALEQLEALGTDAGKSESLNRLEVRAPFDGMIIEKRIALGEAVAADAPVFRISDLSTVWADVSVPAEALGTVRVGSLATVSATAFASQAEGTVFYVGALLGRQNRAATARISLPNPDGAWRPGLFVNVQVASSEAEVPVAVEPAAVHTLEEETVVFARRDGKFVAQAVKTGRRDARAVEILEGLDAGTRYAAANSFVVKSELGKGSASHSH